MLIHRIAQMAARARRRREVGCLCDLVASHFVPGSSGGVLVLLLADERFCERWGSYRVNSPSAQGPWVRCAFWSQGVCVSVCVEGVGASRCAPRAAEGGSERVM